MSKFAIYTAAVLLSGALNAAASCALAAQVAHGYPTAPLHAFRDAPFAPEMMVLPSGTYLMGSTEAETTREKRAAGPSAFEHPQHNETIAAPIAVGRFLVTVGEFDRFVKDTGRAVFDGCNVNEAGTWSMEAKRSYADPAFKQNDRHPAVCVTWSDADAYAAWLSKQTGHHYRLVHEREWEYAARAGTETARWWGDTQDDLCRHANGADISFNKAYPGDKQANLTCDDGYAGTSPVGHFPANPFGLYDMIGNAWEWMGDCFRDSYAPGAPVPNEADCKQRAIRGGSWHNYPNVLRAANRFSLPPTMRASSTGFRVARDPD